MNTIKLNPKFAEILETKNTSRSRNSMCSLLSGALGVCLCLFLAITGDSAGSVHGKCNSLIMYLPFSITPISEGHGNRKPGWFNGHLYESLLLWKEVFIWVSFSGEHSTLLPHGHSMMTTASFKKHMARGLYGILFLVPTPACLPHTLRRLSGAKQTVFPSLSPLTGIYGLASAVGIGFFFPGISLGNSSSSRMGLRWGWLLRPFAPGLRMTSSD